MKRSTIKLLMIGLSFLGLISCRTKNQIAENTKPNIVFILADDLGYGDLGCYGATKINTPHINKLAKNGIRLTDAHSSSAVCTPSRYGILTGRYSWRGRLKKEVLWSGYDRALIEKGRKTIGNMLQESGYRTAQIGKWHLGWEDNEPVDYSKGYLGRGPKQLGFDYSFVTAAAHNLYPLVFVEDHKLLSKLKPMDYFIYEPKNETPEYIIEWHKTHDKGPRMIATDWKPNQVDSVYTEKTISFVKNHVENYKGQSFYVHLTPEAPHLPNNVPDFMKGKSGTGERGDHIQMLDWMVGKIVKALVDLDQFNNTLIVVTSDNGPRRVGIDGNYERKYNGKFVTDFDHKSAGVLHGYKGSLWDGGHRIPFIAHWPAKIKPDQESQNLLCLSDMMATFAAITDYDLDSNMGEDSYNALPIILGQDREVRKSIIHQNYSGDLTMRKDHWKLVGDALFDLSTDMEEKTDLSKQHQEVVTELKNLLKAQIQAGRTRPIRNQILQESP